MKALYDFLASALPWVAIGLFVASSTVMVQAKKEGRELSRLFKGLSWCPMACFLFVAIMEYADGKASSATTWLVLGICNLMLHFMSTQKEDKEIDE